MNEPVKYPVAIATTFIWIGFVCAISFMEAWLKFRAPGMTLPIGLSVGRLVFAALNKVEWILAIAMLVYLILTKAPLISTGYLWIVVPLMLLTIQTLWLLPILDERAEMHIQQKEVTPSDIHFYYVAMEVAKVICLAGFGIYLLRGNE